MSSTQVIATALKLLVRQYFTQHPEQFRGLQGPQGIAGPIGQRGPQGLIGLQGSQGIQGPKGDKGDRGDIGPMGHAGRDGVAGTNGSAGESAGMRWRGEYRKGIEYRKGDIVGWREAVWVCLRNDTYSEPSRGSKSWDLFISIPNSGKVLNSFGGMAQTTNTLTIGNAVGGGGANRVLYEDSSQNLAASANLTFSGTVLTAAGLTVTNAPTFTALTSGRVPFAGTAGLLGDSASLTYDDSAKLVSFGSGSTTSAGWTAGYYGSTGIAGIWVTRVSRAGNNYTIIESVGQLQINHPTSILFNLSDATKMSLSVTAGSGPSFIAGTATTDVAALSVTRTNNNAAVATGVKFAFTDTSSAAGFLPFQVLGGAAAATNLLSVSKAGLVDAPAYSAGGTAGVDFGPAGVASITVKKGIITAIS